MKLTQDELQRLLELVSESDMHTTNCSSIENLFVKLSVEFAKKTIEKDPIVEKKEKPVLKVEQQKFSFKTPTAIASKLLHIKEGDLRALRKCGELKRGYHYETGINPKPSAIFYDLETTCRELHDISWEEFSKPGFDIEANTHRKIKKEFERYRQGAKK